MKRLIAIGLGLIAAAALVVTAMAATITVSGNTTNVENTPGGWMFNRDPGNTTPYAFTTSKASIGVGSLYVKPIGANPSDKFIAEFFMLSPLANVTTISYDFLLGAGRPAADGVQFYMNVYANFGSSPANKYYDCRYDIVVPTGSSAAWTTVVFNPNLPYSVATRGGVNASPFPCPASPAAMNALSAGSTIRVIAINVGDTSASDLGINGYLDRVVVNQTTGSNTYNFDPTKDACKNGGWQTMTRPNGTPFANQGACVSYVENSQDNNGQNGQNGQNGNDNHGNDNDNHGGNSNKTVTVTSTSPNWYPADTRPAGTAVFEMGPATPPLSVGSLELRTPDNSSKVQRFTNLYNGTPISTITGIGYSTFRDPAATGFTSGVAALNLRLDTDNNGSPDAYMVYEPYQDMGNAAVLTGVWQNWDAYRGGAAKWWINTGAAGCGQNTPCTWATIVAALPGATIREGPNCGPGGVTTPCPGSLGVNQGSGNAGFITNVDALYVSVNGNRTTFNFEPFAVATDKDQCKNGGWQNVRRANGTTFSNQGACVSYVESQGSPGNNGNHNDD